MQLSKHFKLEEFEKSMTATRKGIENKAGSGEIKNLTDLCYGVLEPVRAKFDKPITITSHPLAGEFTDISATVAKIGVLELTSDEPSNFKTVNSTTITTQDIKVTNTKYTPTNSPVTRSWTAFVPSSAPPRTC